MDDITAEKDKLHKTLSGNIKKYRTIEGISQEKLAEKCGLSDRLIKDIEGCRSWVSAKTIIKLAQTLNVEATNCSTRTMKPAACALCAFRRMCCKNYETILKKE